MMTTGIHEKEGKKDEKATFFFDQVLYSVQSTFNLLDVDFVKFPCLQASYYTYLK